MLAETTAGDSVDILIAEDDALMRQSLRGLLEDAGYRCTEVDDGPKAVAMARRLLPRCAILDLAMPGLDGFTVARQLREDPRTRGVHIHCLTGRTDLAARQEAHEAGFETYLTKPIDPAQLLRVVHDDVKRREPTVASGLTLAEAQDVLDAWENPGYRDLNASFEEGKGFSVSGVRPSSKP
jgi:CheY-like chemotaxis protein